MTQQGPDSAVRIRKFLSQHIRVDGLADDENFFMSGVVNSLFAMQLVTFVEKEFGVAVENEDLDLKNFNSVDAIAAFVSRKKSA